MLNLRMNMPFVLMELYGSFMILIVLLFRAFLKERLPKFVFPILWCVVLVRLLVPFSLSSPLSIKVSDSSPLSIPIKYINAFSENIAIASDTIQEAVYYGGILEEESLSPGISGYSEDIADATITSYDSSNEAIIEETAEFEDTTTYFIESSGLHIFPRNIVLFAIYFAGLLITLVILLLQKHHYLTRLKNRLLIEHNETINDILREMGMGHILVFTNDEIASPLVCGLFSSHIYLPTRMDFRNTEHLRHILTHETMHIKHRDNWIKTVMLFALCLNWFNPLVWLMSKCLASDLETYCDEAVLRLYHDEETRKSYAFSLLSMAITGNLTPLLYSAFSKTEVEKRIKSILNYKKASTLLLIVTAAFILSSTVVFATGLPAPFSSYLTSYCASSNSRWGVKVEITRDILLGKNAQRRADDIVLNVLSTDTTNDPEVLESQMKEALSNEFNVEMSAFSFDFSLCLSDEERAGEYEEWELTRDEHGYFLYKGDPVRVYIDKMGGYYQSREEGLVDITVQRDRYGYISGVVALREGDGDFDRRTKDIEHSKMYNSTATGSTAETTLIEDYQTN